MKLVRQAIMVAWSLVAVGCISVNSSEYADRHAALNRLETDEELLRCVMTCRYEDVRKEAVGRIRSDEMLLEIALSQNVDGLQGARKLAAMRLGDDECRFRAICESACLDEDARDEIAGKVSSSSVVVRLASCGRVSDRVALELVGKLNEQGAIFAIATNMKVKVAIRDEAARKLASPNSRVRVVTDGCVSDAVAMELAENMGDQAALAEIAVNSRLKANVRIAATRRLMRTDALRRLATLRESAHELRILAVDRLVELRYDCTELFLTFDVRKRDEATLAAHAIRGVGRAAIAKAEIQKRLRALFSALTDEALLVSVFDALICNEIANGETDQDKVARLLLANDSPEFRRKAKLVLLDAEVLEDLVKACEETNPSLAAWGLERIWGDLAHERILGELKTGDAIAKAVSLIGDERRLASIAMDVRKGETARLHAIQRLSGGSAEVLRKLAVKDRAATIARAARERLDALKADEADDLGPEYEEAKRIRERIDCAEDVRRSNMFVKSEIERLEMEESLQNCREWARISVDHNLSSRERFRFRGVVKESVSASSSEIRLTVEGKTIKADVRGALSTPLQKSHSAGERVEIKGEFKMLDADEIVLAEAVVTE